MSKEIYEPCAHIKKTVPDQTVDKALMKSIADEFRTLPTFEHTAFEHKFIKHYSLERNERLKCGWKQYRDNIDRKVFAPFLFPESRDLHFYNGTIRFMPSLTISRQPDQKLKLKPGPRVDWRGQTPIPYELLMKRETAHKEDKPAAKPKKEKEIDTQEEKNFIKINMKIDPKKFRRMDRKKGSVAKNEKEIKKKH